MLELPGRGGPLQALVGLVGTERGCGEAFYERAGQTMRREEKDTAGLPTRGETGGSSREQETPWVPQRRRVGQEDAQLIPGTHRAPLENATGALRETEEKGPHPALPREGEFGASRLPLGI